MIREMVAADYSSVMSIWQQSEGMTLREVDSEVNIAAYLARNEGLSFVAVEAGELVGAVLAGTDGRRGYLQHLAVLPEFRKQGLGRMLTEHVVAALKRIGIEKTHLFVHTSNLEAQDFYQNLGWGARDEVRMFSLNASDNKEI